MTLALLDGDIIAYAAATGSTKEVDWGDGAGSQPCIDLPAAVDTACRVIDDWTRLAGATSPHVCFSSRTGSNFRKIIDPTYKAGRPDKPAAYWGVVDAIEARFKFHRVEGLEADDLMGVLGTRGDRETVIVSLDKDMQTLPARILNPNKDTRPRTIGVAQADYFWLTQTLTGDPTDGYKGCPKIGPVKAARILDPHTPFLGAMWFAVVDTYETADLTLEHALTQARLARILRSSDYDRETKEIILWHLTTPERLALSALTAPQTTPAPDVWTPAIASAPERETKPSGVKRSRRKT